MDINGAKALRDRLGSNGAGEASTSALDADVPEDAPPVYRWLGVPHATKASGRNVEDTPAGSEHLVVPRLGLSFR